MKSKHTTKHSMQRLTDYQKKLRGTFQPSRAAKAKTSAEIEIAVAEMEELISALMLVLDRAKESVKTLGVESTVTARNNANETTVQLKLNPAVKIVLDTPAKVRLARRELAALNEELAEARDTESHADEPNKFDRFAGL
jgi:thymidylate kinase